MSKGHLILSMIIVVILLAVGCTGSGSPVIPDIQEPKDITCTPNNQVLLGLYDIEIDSLTGMVEVIPIRGPAFQVNVVQYLQPPLGNPANLGISINPDGCDYLAGIFDLDISITHPFPGTNLRGFDVRGILLGEKGTQLSEFDWDIQYPKPTEARLLNADGYTRWWNAVEFLTPGLFGYTPGVLGNTSPKATVNGYKYFTDGLEAGDPLVIDIENRGTFSTIDGASEPNTLTRQFVIKFPVPGGTPKVKFQYAICASFAGPSPGTPPPAPIDAFSLSANCPEAYQISATVDPTSTAYYTSTQSGGDLVLNIEIFDWQATENPGGVEGELGYVLIESPTLWDGYIDMLATATPITSDNPTSSAWQIEIENVVPTDYLQDVFIIAQSADPTSYAPPVPGGGIYPGGAKLAAYQLVTLDMPGNSPPEIGLISGPEKYVDGAELTYNLSSMTDLQDGSNLTALWDFDGDGVFEDDEDGSDTNLNGAFTFYGEDPFYVQCRVVDTALAHTDSNILEVLPMSLPFIDPMDATTESLWTVQNGLFGSHSASVEWNVQIDHWSSSSPDGSYYDNYMDTTLVSPMIPAGDISKVSVSITHRYDTENFFDSGWIYYQLNGSGWTLLSPEFNDTSPGYPDYIIETFYIEGLTPTDYFELGFNFNTDGSSYFYPGWDIDHLLVMDNVPPEIEGIWGPDSVDELGVHQYSTVANDLDGIATYMWSVEFEGDTPVYDDPGDGFGNIDVTFPADGNYEIWVEATDAGTPPLSSTFGPHDVAVFTTNPDAFFFDDFDEDTGAWTYTGGIADGSYQDFWHIETANSFLSNVGPDGCYAEEIIAPIEKTASCDITFPVSTDETRMRMLHTLATDASGGAQPYDGQWVTLDGMLIEPSFGFLYNDNGGLWDHGYFVGYTTWYEVSTFLLGTDYNDGNTHTLTFHQLSSDNISNCQDGWQIDYVELWLVE